MKKLFGVFAFTVVFSCLMAVAGFAQEGMYYDPAMMNDRMAPVDERMAAPDVEMMPISEEVADVLRAGMIDIGKEPNVQFMAGPYITADNLYQGQPWESGNPADAYINGQIALISVYIDNVRLGGSVDPTTSYYIDAVNCAPGSAKINIAKMEYSGDPYKNKVIEIGILVREDWAGAAYYAVEMGFVPIATGNFGVLMSGVRTSSGTKDFLGSKPWKDNQYILGEKSSKSSLSSLMQQTLISEPISISRKPGEKTIAYRITVHAPRSEDFYGLCFDYIRLIEITE